MLKLLKKIHMNTWIAVLSYILTFAFLYSATVRATHEPMGSVMFSAFLSVGFFIPVNIVMSAIAKLGVRIVNRVRSDAEATNEAGIVDDTAPGRTARPPIPACQAGRHRRHLRAFAVQQRVYGCLPRLRGSADFSHRPKRSTVSGEGFRSSGSLRARTGDDAYGIGPQRGNAQPDARDVVPTAFRIPPPRRAPRCLRGRRLRPPSTPIRSTARPGPTAHCDAGGGDMPTRIEDIDRYLQAYFAAEHTADSGPGGEGPGFRPFVTISRQAGVGGHELADDMLEVFHAHSNRALFGGWQIFDRSICEIVAGDPPLLIPPRSAA